MSEEPAAGFAGLLRRLRTEARLTQDELAVASGVSTRAISDLERAVNLTARRDTAEMLAGALHLDGTERARFVAVARGKPVAAPEQPPGPAAGTGPGGTPAAGIPSQPPTLAETRLFPGRAGPPEAAASNVAWLESALSPAFVGRQRELGVLREAWSAARDGRRVLALVSGEPGIGKTALTAELARRVRGDDGLVLYGRWDEDVLAPYQAFREALTDYARACPERVLRQDMAGLAAETARICPVPAQRLRVSAARPLSAAEAERFRLFESVDTWFGRMAARHPVLLVLDDLQWADQSSLVLLPYLMRARRSAPLLTVAMYRDTGPERSEFSSALPSLTRDIDSRRLALRGLSRGAVAALLPGRERDVIDGLERETAGNPFYLLEMSRHLSEGGELSAGAAAHDGAPAGIPESVRDMVRSRIGRLSAGCTEILAIAALIGERFDAALLAASAGLEETATISLLEEAERAGLVAEIDDTVLPEDAGFPEDTESAWTADDSAAGGDVDHWRFAHSLTRRVTAEELSRSRRARLHHRIGETLEARPGTPPAELAHHFGAAAKGAAEKAAAYERLAGQRALAEVAAEVAVRHFRRALGLAHRLGPENPLENQRLRCELLLELAGAHDRAGEYAPRDDRFAEAADAARNLPDSDLPDGGLFLRAALGYGGVLPATVSLDPRAQALLTEALQRLGGTDSGARAMVMARLAHWLHTARPYAERRQLSDRSVAMARAAGDPRTLATVLTHRSFALDGPADVADALAVADEIIGIGGSLSDPELTLEGLRIRLHAQFENGDQAAAAATALELKRLAEGLRHPEFIRLAAMWDVTVADLEGRFADAAELAAQLHERLYEIGHPQAQVIPFAQRFSRSWLQGHAAEYVPQLKALSAAEPGNLAWPAVTVWCLAESGDRDEAAAVLAGTKPADAAAADANYLWWAVIAGFAGAADLTGDRDWAAALYELALPYAGRNCTLGVASFLGAADHWLGVLAATAGRLDEAAGHLEAALHRHQAMGARPWAALTQEAYGHVLSARGRKADATRAAALTGAALRTAEELGLAAVTRRPALRGRSALRGPQRLPSRGRVHARDGSQGGAHVP
jgi:transcriptional regulator with XRE-family HTH domain